MGRNTRKKTKQATEDDSVPQTSEPAQSSATTQVLASASDSPSKPVSAVLKPNKDKKAKKTKKKVAKKKVSALTEKELERINLMHAEAVAALKNNQNELSDADKQVVQQLEKLKAKIGKGKSVSVNLLKTAKDLFMEKERQQKAAKIEAEKRKRDEKAAEKQAQKEKEIQEKNGQEKSTAAQST